MFKKITCLILAFTFLAVTSCHKTMSANKAKGLSNFHEKNLTVKTQDGKKYMFREAYSENENLIGIQKDETRITVPLKDIKKIVLSKYDTGKSIAATLGIIMVVGAIGFGIFYGIFASAMSGLAD